MRTKGKALFRYQPLDMIWKQPRLFILGQIPTACPQILKQYFNLIHTFILLSSCLAFVTYLPFLLHKSR